MSSVWKFFKKGDNNNDSASCNLCGKSYKTCGNTTNLATHLKNRHHFAYLQMMKMPSSLKTTKSSEETEDAAAVDLNNSNLSLPSTSTGYKNCQQSQEDVTVNPAEMVYHEAKKRKQSTLVACLERGSSFEVNCDEHTHTYKDGEQVVLWMNTVGPYHNRQETYAYFSLPFCVGTKVTIGHYHETLSEALQGVELEFSGLDITFKDNVPAQQFCGIELNDQAYKALVYAVKNHYLYQMYIDDLPIWGIVGEIDGDHYYIWTNKKFDIGCNGNRIVEVNLTAENKERLVPDAKIPFTYEAHSGQYIKECWEEICEEFHIDKNKIVAITTDGGANIVAAVRLFLGNDRRISCMAHCLNLIVDGVLKENQAFSALCDHVNSIVTYFKQSVNAMDQLRSEQEVSGMQEGEVLTLTQAVTTRWNSCFDMLKRFTTLSALVAKILATKSQTSRNTPDMVATSQLNIIRDIVAILGPFKEATEVISGANYVTSSLAIPVTNLIRQAVETLSPSTSLGLIVKEALLKKVQERLVPLQENSYLSAATILDPRFKKIHFNSPIAVSHAIAKISNDIRSEHRRRGQFSPNLRTIQIGKAQEKTESSIWSGHEKLLSQSTTVPEVPSSGSVPNELKQYLDQPLIERKADPIKFWTNCQHFTPVLSEVALKYLICQASSVSSERVASAVNITVPDNRSRLTGEHVKQRVLIMSISDEYWFD
ncbi:unnamed protein product [Parnassius apollo]|uniref:(apollo) hypothetical protein n=1 Tax=Parnassius apollo TaxID=110799 RepID=A0A8S3X736_PARAO|nr:unnamed protein product [Parnassius apollo]